MSRTGSPPPRLSELIAALPVATDLGLGEPMEHVLRSCLISMRLDERIGLNTAERAVSSRRKSRGSGLEVEAHCGVGRHTV